MKFLILFSLLSNLALAKVCTTQDCLKKMEKQKLALKNCKKGSYLFSQNGPKLKINGAKDGRCHINRFYKISGSEMLDRCFFKMNILKNSNIKFINGNNCKTYVKKGKKYFSYNKVKMLAQKPKDLKQEFLQNLIERKFPSLKNSILDSHKRCSKGNTVACKDFEDVQKMISSTCGTYKSPCCSDLLTLIKTK